MRSLPVRASALLLLLAPAFSCLPMKRTEEPVTLRPFPYPYRAALALSSDVDGTETAGEFLTIQRFLAGTGPTLLGDGLGLEVGNSFWFLDTTGQSSFTYFQDAAGRLSPSARLIEEMIAAGYIDVIHGYGEFGAGTFDREMAARCIRALEDIRIRRGVVLSVWSHHGDAKNVQNVGPLSYEKGDDPQAPEYHADLLRAYGVKFLDMWQVTHIIGQDAPRRYSDYVKEAAVAGVYARNALFRREQNPYLWTNELIYLTHLDDGQAFYGYRRFINSWGFGSLDASGLVQHLSPSNLGELRRKQGTMIVYTHLGGGNEDAPELLGERTRLVLTDLARSYRDGEILVTTTSRLLTYNLAYHRLRWNVQLTGAEAVIEITEMDDEVEGSHPPRPEELMGITFYVPSCEWARILVGGKEVIGLDRRPADETGRESVGFPWQPLRFPDVELPVER